MSAKNFLGLKYLRKIKKKIILDPKIFGTHKFFFLLISTPEFLELNSKFVRPKKNFDFGFGIGSRPKTQVFFGSNV